MKIQGKTYIVTGGCGAIGQAVARELSKRGAIVAVFDVLSPEKGNAIVKEYTIDGTVLYFQTDVSEVEQVTSHCNDILEKVPKGSLAGVVHCAAISRKRQWSNKMTDSCADFKEIMKVNIYGTFVIDACVADAINSQYPSEGVFPPRVTEERGVIVNFASAVANPVPARCLTYGPTKTAVLGITSGAADFLGPSGIRVVSVSPAVVASEMIADRMPYFETELNAMAVFPRRASKPEEIVHGVIFLIENSMMNACDLRPDGAWRTGSCWGGGIDAREVAPSLE